jgi:hypothetical protein
MEPVKFVYFTREYFFKDILIFTGSSEFDSKSFGEQNEIFVKYCHKIEKLKDISKEKLLKGRVIKKLSAPKTFPKFSNEKPFKILWNKSFIYNPQIIAIRWSGYEWEYRIKNIGHEYDYQSETKLEKI